MAWNDRLNAGTVNIISLGAVGDGATNNSSVFSALTGPTNVGPGNFLISSSITISQPLYFEANSKITVASGVTVTFTKPVQAGTYQRIFDGVGTVTGVIGDTCLSVWWFGATGDGSTDDRAAIQAAFNAAVGSQKMLFFPTPPSFYRCSGSISAPANWKGIHIKGEVGGSAALVSHGTVVRFDNSSGGFVIGLNTSSHEQVTIESLVIRNAGTKGGSGIKFAVDGTRSYNYPIGWWLDLLSFDNWQNAVEFNLNGGSFEPAAYLGRIELSRIHTWQCVNSVFVYRMFLNLFSMRACRFHVGGTIRLDNGGGYYGLYDVHWEAARSRFHLANSCYEARFSLHNCGGEKNGEDNGSTHIDGLVEFSGTAHSRAFLWDFSGDTQLPGAFEAPPDANHWVRLRNNGIQNITVNALGCSIETPDTIDVAPPEQVASVDGQILKRIRWYWTPTAAYGANTSRNATAQPFAGTRAFGGTSITVKPTTAWPWLEGSVQYSTNEAVPVTPDVTVNQRMFVVSFVAEMTSGVSRLGNPMVFSFGGSDTGYRYTDLFYFPTGEYSCSVLCRADGTYNGSPLPSLSTVEVSLTNAGRQSIGYGSWQAAVTTTAVKLAHPVGHSYPTALKITNGNSASIAPRGSPGDLIRQRIVVRAGGAYAEVVCTGVCGNNATKNQSLTVNQPYGGVTFAATDGPTANDFGGITITNASGADVTVFATIEL